MLKITLRREIDQISSTFISISYISNNKKQLTLIQSH